MTSAYASLNGVRIVSASLSTPLYGAWVGDFMLATDAPIATTANIKIDGLSLAGSVVRSAPFAGARTARVVGGAGGWSRALASKSYYLAGGVPLSMVLRDVASEVGETLNLAVLSGTVGSYYTIAAGMLGAEVLAALAGPQWWIDAAGVTQVRARPSSPILSQYDVIERDGGRGLYEVATETLQDWVPGNTFVPIKGTTGTATISLARVDISNEGKARVHVLAEGAANE
jgi:hypothetical protein